MSKPANSIDAIDYTGIESHNNNLKMGAFQSVSNPIRKLSLVDYKKITLRKMGEVGLGEEVVQLKDRVWMTP